MAVTCHHVVGDDRGAPVYQPQIVGTPAGALLPLGRLNPIGVVADPGAAAGHSFAYPGEPTRRYFVDCAAIGLSRMPAPAGSVRGGRADPLDIAGRRGLLVRLLGVRDHSRGRIVDVAATVPRQDGPDAENTIVIETVAGQPPFAGAGDSGAVVVDQFGRAVGLLWGVDLARPTRAFACHLLPALDLLGLVLLRRVPPLGHRGSRRWTGVRSTPLASAPARR